MKRIASILLLVVIVAPVRAGSLDRAILEKSGDLIAYLKDNKIANIGVLPFEVQRGARRTVVGDAPLSLTLPTRIENALIITMAPNEKLAVGVIRDATGTARQAGIGSYRLDQSAFKKLFDLEYDLAWGGKRGRANGFLTGTVISSGTDRSATTVHIDLLTPTSWRDRRLVPEKRWSIQVPTDTLLAAELGYHFSLSPLALSRGGKGLNRTRLVADQIASEDEAGSRTPGSAHTPDNIAGFAFELLYDGKKQTLKSIGQGPGALQPEYRAPTPEVETRISMCLTRMDREKVKLAVLLMVNGQSTFNHEMGDPLLCRKWVYDEERVGRKDEWKGFYTGTEGKNLLPFKALTKEESAPLARELGTRAGWIDIHVFASIEKAVDEADEKVMLISPRSLELARSKKSSLKELRAGLMQANNLKRREPLGRGKSVGGLILHEMEPIEGGKIGTADFPCPVLIGRLAIRYFEPK
jgi:hypothetical protein